MKLITTMKIKVSAEHKMLIDMSETFSRAVQYAIDKGFAARTSNRYKLHRLIYKDIRQWLPADFAVEAIGKAAENLKSVNLKIKPIIKKQVISWNRKLFTFSFDKLRIATFNKKDRRDITLSIPEYYWRYLDWSYQTLELINHKGILFWHITFSREVNPRPSCSNEIVGVDLGVNNLAVTSNGRIFKTPKTRIKQFRFLRNKLQAKGTKSAKRHLRALSGRQKRYMTCINHIISKEIVSNADTIVLENLKGIRKGGNQFMGKRVNRWLNNWSFYQLQKFIKYKAERMGKTVLFINPYMTSKICSSCGSFGSRNLDFFSCSHCGFSSQSDFNASCNLRRLSVNQPIVANDDVKAKSELKQSSATSLTSQV